MAGLSDGWTKRIVLFFYSFRLHGANTFHSSIITIRADILSVQG
jgi:hypothetical protein